MGLSLKELKEQLIAKQGYTITPNHSQLANLKALVDDMMNVRSGAPPSTGSGSYSGTNCAGHVKVTSYKLSLGDIKNLDIKGCSCHTVNDTTGYCTSRTYTCSCNGNTPTCQCNTRIGACSCNSDTPSCNCNSRTPSICDCQSRTGGSPATSNYCSCNLKKTSGDYCDCDYNRSTDGLCTYNSDISYCSSNSANRFLLSCSCHFVCNPPNCNCYSRTSENCDCQGRTSACGIVNPSDVSCGSRTSSCGSRDIVNCTCNGRCACNVEKRFA